MPTNQTVYNSRVTDEALEKRFRDTFRAQGGAELVDDLYASGVIVPVVDFTQAATGDVLAQNLQTAWDFTTGYNQVVNATASLISTAGFWQVDLTATQNTAISGFQSVLIQIDSGITTKTIWAFSAPDGGTGGATAVAEGHFVVFLRSGDTLKAVSNDVRAEANIWYRQIATVNGDLVNPFGFTSS